MTDTPTPERVGELPGGWSCVVERVPETGNWLWLILDASGHQRARGFYRFGRRHAAVKARAFLDALGFTEQRVAAKGGASSPVPDDPLAESHERQRAEIEALRGLCDKMLYDDNWDADDLRGALARLAATGETLEEPTK